jgi:hypothetical protein
MLEGVDMPIDHTQYGVHPRPWVRVKKIDIFLMVIGGRERVEGKKKIEKTEKGRECVEQL